MKSIFRQIAWLSLPLAAVHLGQVTLGLVDAMFLGRVGAAELAAVSLGNGVFFTVTTLGLGIVFGAEPLISQAVGAGDPLRARRGLRVAILVATVASLPVALMIVGFLGLLSLVGIDPEVVELTRDYVLARLPGLLGFYLFLAFKAYLQAHNFNAPAVYGIVIAVLFNVPLDGVLIFGDDALIYIGLQPVGLPALGVFGSGIATSVSSWLRFVVLAPFVWVHVRRGPDDVVGERWRSACTRERIGKVLRVGIPIGLQLFWEVGMFAVVSLLMGTIGKHELAAHQVALQLCAVPFHVTMGIGTATTVVVGQAVGRGDKDGVLRAGVAGIIIGTGIMSASAVVFVAAPELLVGLFTSDAEVIGHALVLIQIGAAFALFDGAQAVAGGALRGAGDTVWAFVGHLVGSWVMALPVGVVLCFVLDWGPVGLWWGLTAGLATAAVVLCWRFVVGARRGYLALE